MSLSFQSDLGLDVDSNDLLETVLREANINDFDQFDKFGNGLEGFNLNTPHSEDPKEFQLKHTLTDHDYYQQQKSPTHSDSGVSLDSSAYSPVSMATEDQQAQYSPREDCLSESPRSQSNLSLEEGVGMDQSPYSGDSNSSAVGLDEIDMNNINVDNLSTDDLNLSKLLNMDFMDCMGDAGLQADDVSINLGDSGKC